LLSAPLREVLIEKIKEGIQEKKGKNIIIADLTNIEDTICKFPLLFFQLIL